MKLFLSISILSSCLSAEIIDLGNYGNSYNIEEISYMEELKTNWSKVDKKALYQEAKTMVDNATKVSIKELSLCKAYDKRKYEPFYTLSTPLGSPELGFYYPSGFRFNKLEMMAKNNLKFDYNLYFVDSTEEFHLDLMKTDPTGLIFIANGDIKDVYKAYKKPGYSAADYKEFGVKCLPSIVHQDGNSFVIEEFDYETLKKRYKK